MEDADLDFSNPEVFSTTPELLSSGSMDSFFDEILKDTHACTHTHTCNPPGPDLSHTHTCFHVHTKILSGPTDETADSPDKNSTKKRPFGNREAVRKYREKKKARAASLEEEVAQLRALNQQLMKRLQGKAALEAEVVRLRCLLVDIRGRIDGELGSFPYQKPVKVGSGGDLDSNMVQGNLIGSARVLNSCNLRCDDQGYCLYPGMQGKVGDEGVVANSQGCGGCEMGNIHCMTSSTLLSQDFFGCGSGNGMAIGCSSNVNKIGGTPAATDG